MLMFRNGVTSGRRPARIGATVALAAALGLLVGIASPAFAMSPMLQGWLAVNAQCKGGVPGDPKTLKACARRDELSEKLKRRGCQYREDGDWWQCRR